MIQFRRMFGEWLSNRRRAEQDSLPTPEQIREAARILVRAKTHKRRLRAGLLAAVEGPGLFEPPKDGPSAGAGIVASESGDEAR
jgi:hypothetical protein